MKRVHQWLELQLAAQNPSWSFFVITAPLAKLYGAAVGLRNHTFDRGSRTALTLPGRVLSVGNIAIGGTGKSPIVIALATRLLNRGARPVILARGYGAGLSANESMILRNREIIWRSHVSQAKASDEGLMQSAILPNVPVVLGANRKQAAQAFLAQIKGDPQPTHWLLDDGFQHRAIARDCDIILVDAAYPLGSGRLLPSGNLREPAATLARAQLVIATRAQTQDAVIRVREILSPYYRGPLLGVPFLTTVPHYLPELHAPVMIVAGIANPERFSQTVRELGVEVGSHYFVRDHSVVDRQEVSKRLQNCRSVVTTAKDFWRDPQVFRQLPVHVLLAELAPKIDFNLVDRWLFDE